MANRDPPSLHRWAARACSLSKVDSDGDGGACSACKPVVIGPFSSWLIWRKKKRSFEKALSQRGICTAKWRPMFATLC